MFWKLLLAIVTGIWAVHYFWQRRRFHRLLEEIPSCNIPTWPVLGNAHIFAGNDEDRMNALKIIGRNAVAHGGISSFWMGHKYYISIADPEPLQVVLKSCLDKDDTTMKFIRTVTGNGNIFAPVKIWRPRRKILTPVFSTKNLNSFVNVFSKNSQIMARSLEFEAGFSDFSVWNYMTTYSFDAVCETALGIELCSQQRAKNPFLDSFDTLTKIISERFMCPWLYSDVVFELLPSYKKFYTNRKVVLDFVDEIVSKKRKELADVKKNKNTIKAKDTEMKTFLEMVLESSGGDKGYSNLELREEVLVIIFAGTDTSAVGAAYTSVLLSRYPDVQQRVFQELQDVFGDSTRPVKPEDLPSLKYLEAVIKETMRLYPPVPVIAREVHQDVKLPSGTTLVDGVHILVNIWATHRNPKYWGKDAEQFRPERFLEGPLKHPAQFIPFSFSFRNCVGASYAMMSMKTVLATMLRQYRLLPPVNMEPYEWAAPLRLKYDIMMKHVDNYRLRIEKRDKAF